MITKLFLLITATLAGQPRQGGLGLSGAGIRQAVAAEATSLAVVWSVAADRTGW